MVTRYKFRTTVSPTPTVDLTQLLRSPDIPSFTPVKLTVFLIFLLITTLSTPCLAAGYHVYDWKGKAKEKDGKVIRESRWQPGFVMVRNEERRVGKSK